MVMSYDGYDTPTLSDFALFLAVMAWRMSPLVIIPSVVVGVCVMMGVS